MSFSYKILCLIAIFFSFLEFPADVYARIFHADPKNYRALVKKLEPGDTLQLEAGYYLKGLNLADVRGTNNAFIYVSGPSKGRRAIFKGPVGNHTLILSDSAYLVISNLELDGAGVAVNGVRTTNCKYTHDITIRNLYIHGYGNHQQKVGISTKCPAWNWKIQGNVIRDVGTGMYLGNSNGHEPFINGVIEENIILDTVGYNLQIKHQLVWPDNIPGIPKERVSTIIRRNFFSKDGAPVAGASPRPNVLVGHRPLSGNGTNSQYLIYGNVFYQNPREALFQGEGNLNIYNNLFINEYRTNFSAVVIQPHKSVPREVRVFNNTVVARNKGIYVTGGSEAHQQFVFGNAVFAELPVRAGNQWANVVDSYANAVNYLKRPFGIFPLLDLKPIRNSLNGHEYKQAIPKEALMADRDIIGKKRTGWVRGAFGNGASEGWIKNLREQMQLIKGPKVKPL